MNDRVTGIDLVKVEFRYDGFPQHTQSYGGSTAMESPPTNLLVAVQTSGCSPTSGCR